MTLTLLSLILAASSIIPKALANEASSINAISDRPSSSVAQCAQHIIPLRVTSQNLVFNITKFKNDLNVANLITEVVRKDSNVTFHPVSGIENITAEYTISGTFCSPKVLPGNGREKTVLLASHGGAYDGRYWDSSYKPQEYSFVEAMVRDGYSVFYYDRLGLGNSSVVSGYTSQASIQIEILASLTNLLRNGQYSGTIGTPNSVVLVGHSFGSFVTSQAIAKYPLLADAAILTGTAYDATVNTNMFFIALASRIASQHDPRKYSHLDTGYLTFADIAAHATAFFKAPYEVEAALYAHAISAPIGIGEIFSLAASSVARDFTGPLLVTAGEFDLAFCGGECYSTFREQRIEDVFPNSRLKSSFVHPGAGHGLNFARNATGFYMGLSAFLKEAGF